LRWELDVCTALGTTLIATRGYSDPEVRQVHLRAEALCEQLTDPAQQLPTLYNLWAFHLVAGELRESRALAVRMSELTAGVEDDELRLVTSSARVQDDLFRGELSSSGDAIRDVLARYDPGRHADLARRYGQEDPGVTSLCQDAWRLWLSGFADQAVIRAREALTLAERLGQPYGAALARFYALTAHQFRGDVPAVHREAEALEALATEQGFDLLLALSKFFWGWAAAAAGDAAGGLARMERGLEAVRSTGTGLLSPYFLTILVETHLSLGQVESAGHRLAEARAQVEKSGERWWEAELHRLEGEVLIAAGDDGPGGGAGRGPAEACFRRALEVAHRQGAKSLELRAASSLSRLGGQGRGREARRLLGELVEGFTEGHDTADLRSARAQLADVS
jgi:predicted ATPase